MFTYNSSPRYLIILHVCYCLHKHERNRTFHVHGNDFFFLFLPSLFALTLHCNLILCYKNYFYQRAITLSTVIIIGENAQFFFSLENYYLKFQLPSLFHLCVDSTKICSLFLHHLKKKIKS